ncbi:MAG: type II toxin-antitoxin system RelE/ParE family toxin [Chloroflexi bacterium]|nr:type II toxin-antitoxin system RelE/ParE family toxin [Chloroflexota bacterium]
MSTYNVYVIPQALREIKNVPGNLRQRIIAKIDDLENEPRPPASKELIEIPMPRPNVHLHRLRLDKWRIVYAIDETDKAVDILAIRKRPPYDYGDLTKLLQQIR